MNIIVAIDFNNAIGYQGKLLYRISEDLKRFRQLTEGNTVIMGRKTFESLPNGALPNRENVVITTDTEYQNKHENIIVYNSLEDALSAYSWKWDKLFIIGGASIYKQALDYMKIGDKILMTLVAYSGRTFDTVFPEPNVYEYKTESDESWRVDETTNLVYKYVDMVKYRNVYFKKIFISLPFTGQENTISERLKKAEEYVANVLSSPDDDFVYECVVQSNIDDIIKNNESLTNEDYNEMMIDDLREISRCDAILMTPGWENSKGCCLEHQAAKVFGIKIYYQN